MRKLKLEMQVSLDGFTASADGDVSWMVWPWSEAWPWDDALQAHHNHLTTTSDCILISGRMAEEGFCDHWERVACDAANPQSLFAAAIVATPKLVVTRTMASSRWKNAELFRGDLAEGIARLKREPGKDILAYGGPTLASALMDAQLIDEMHVFINPAVLGQGRKMFKDIRQRAALQARRATCYPCGMVVLEYVVKHPAHS
ncbi:MAG TPA: dihydrofolate reductase family protein [Burkholderiaceae bacterium]|nr:dihydrofolate reductase family protein [Burkholderiaceae bacterium]